jgi:hypothetical protein
MHLKFWLVKSKGGDHLEDLDIDGRIMLKWILNNIHVAHDRDHWWALVNMVMSL